MKPNPHLHDWPKIIRELLDATGWTQKETAQKIGCSQSVFSELLNGNIKDVKHSIAAPLLGLHRYHTRIKRKDES